MGWRANATQRTFTPGKQPRHPLYRRLGRPQGRPGRVWRKATLLSPPGFKPSSPLRVAISAPVALNRRVAHSQRFEGEYRFRIQQPGRSTRIIPTMDCFISKTNYMQLTLLKRPATVRDTIIGPTGLCNSNHLSNFEIFTSSSLGLPRHDTWRASCSLQ